MNILIKPLITEKAMREAAMGRYTFAVLKSANKPQIGSAVKEAFKVDPTRVSTVTMPGKTRRSGKTRLESTEEKWKKAIITLKPGQKIDLFDVTEEKHA